MTPAMIQSRNQSRLLVIDQCLRRQRGKISGMTRDEINGCLNVKNLGASLSTFNRDMRRLRKGGAPIECKRMDGVETSTAVYWRYSDPTWTFSNVQISEGDLFGLLVAQHVLEQVSGVPIADHLRRAFDAIAAALNGTVSIRHDTLLPIACTAEKPEPITPDVWSEVAKATIRRRQLEITYRKGWGNEQGALQKRLVLPYHIVNLQGSWYLLATASSIRPDLRQYALTRITQAKATKQKFVLPPGFDIKTYLDVTFGQFMGDPDNVVEVRVQFNKRVAPLVMSRQFSANEQKTILPSGDIEMRFRASSAGPWPLYHVKSWVLSWGADVEVLAPESLRELLRQEVMKMTNISTGTTVVLPLSNEGDNV